MNGALPEATMRKTLFFTVVSMVLLVAAVQPASTKSYWFPEVDIDVTVREDGSFVYREARTYDFSGDFTFAFYQVMKTRLAGRGEVDVTDLAISENGRELDERGAHEIDGDRVPGAYWVDYDYGGNSVYAKWYYRADDERRTFVISYTVHDAVTVYDDHAQLYWKFIAGNWEVPTRRVTGTIHLPDGAVKDEVRAWLHAVLTSEYEIVDGRTIRFEVDNLPPGRFVELRVLFPPSLVPGASERASGTIWDEAYEEEARWVEEANARRRRAQETVESMRRRQRAALPLSIAAAAIALAVWGGLFARYGREHRVRFEGQYFRDLPSERPPAEVGYLMRSGDVNAQDMVATIMDLARRGYFGIREEQHTDRSLLEKLGGQPEFDYVIEWKKQDLSELRDYEKGLVMFLFSSSAAKGSELSLHEFKKDARKHSTEFHSWFMKWR